MTTDKNEIPIESPWFFKYSFQGYMVKKKYLEYDHLASLVEFTEKSTKLDDKHEELESAQFSSKYGREGNPIFRKLIAELKDKKIATNSELMTLVMGGDIYYSESSIAKIKAPTLTALSGVFLLILSFLVISAFTFLIVMADISFPLKALLLLFYIGVPAICSYYFYKYSIYPYLLAKKLRASLQSFISNFQRREQFSLKLVGENKN